MLVVMDQFIRRIIGFGAPEAVFHVSDERKQCEILNKLFGDDFVVPEPPDGSSKKKAAYASPGIVGSSQGA